MGIDKLVVLNDWLAIERLPFYLWNKAVFNRLRDLFGKLLEIDKKVTNYSFFLYAKIKGSKTDFFHSSFDFYVNRKTYKLLARNSWGSSLARIVKEVPRKQPLSIVLRSFDR